MGLGSPSRHALPSVPGLGHTDGSAGAGSARVPPWLCAASAPAATTREASGPRPGPRPQLRPSTSQPEHPAPGSKLPLSSSPLPQFGFNSGRAAVRDPPTLVSSGFLSRSRFSAPHPPFSASSFDHSSPRPCPLLARRSRESASPMEPRGGPGPAETARLPKQWPQPRKTETEAPGLGVDTQRFHGDGGGAGKASAGERGS